MTPKEAQELETAQKLSFPWGDFKGTILQFVPSKLLQWTAANYSNDRMAAACDLIWNYREDTGTHYEE